MIKQCINKLWAFEATKVQESLTVNDLCKFDNNSVVFIIMVLQCYNLKPWHGILSSERTYHVLLVPYAQIRLTKVNCEKDMQITEPT